ncbi:hypothetical protein TNCV_3276611 [Trichonephila clavipes]|nr:hypothetical protein TNCV_3276611 [Trichonephila clavipes]
MLLMLLLTATCLTMSDQGPRNSSWQGANCTPVVSSSFEHHAGDRALWIGSTPILREDTLGVIRDLPHLFPFHQPHERTCGSTAV